MKQKYQILPIKTYKYCLPNQYADTELPHVSRDHVLVSNIMKTTFIFGNESTEKANSIVKNAGRALMNKMMLMLGLKEADIINNTVIYDLCNDLYWSQTEHEEKLLQVI